MNIKFAKYSATGNTFIILDNRRLDIKDNQIPSLIKKLKDESKEIFDGLLLVAPSAKANVDFRMRYYNQDDGEVSMCGNGLRSIVHYFFYKLNTPGQNKNRNLKVETMNSVYDVEVKSEHLICIHMKELYDLDLVDVAKLYSANSCRYLNTGVPHTVYFVNEPDSLDVPKIGHPLCYHQAFKEGCNINFAKVTGPDSLYVRTYERGVGETLSCGTGVTAVAISRALESKKFGPYRIKIRGGELEVNVSEDLKNITLAGPADLQYIQEIDL